MKRIENIQDLTPDPDNANLGTQRGRGVLQRSIQQRGAGRSILVDRNGVVIAGNKTLEVAEDVGLKIRVVATDGTELIVHQRTDLDLLADPEARLLAYEDNRAGQLGLEWSAEQLASDRGAGVDLSMLWTPDELDAFHMGTPSLDDLAEKYGEIGERDSWPVIRVQVSPETYGLYVDLLRKSPGADDAGRMAGLLAAVDVAALEG